MHLKRLSVTLAIKEKNNLQTLTPQLHRDIKRFISTQKIAYPRCVQY